MATKDYILGVTTPPPIDSSLEGAPTTSPVAQKQQHVDVPLINNGDAVEPKKDPTIAPPAKIEPQSAPTTLKTSDSVAMTYADMYRRLNPYTPPTDEDLAKEKKKQKRDQIFAAIGNGVSALANLYFTTQGAPNMYTGKNTASERTQIRYDKLKKEREANNTAYYNGMMRAMQADDEKERDARNWKRQLGLDEQEKQRYDDNIKHRDQREGIADKRYDDETEYKKTRDKLGDEHWKKEFDQRAKQFGAQNALAWANHRLAVQSQKDEKELRQQQIQATGAKAARGKQLGFSDGKGNQVSVYENVWKGSMQQVYDSMLSDLAPKDPKEKARWERQMKKNDTPQKKEDYVKQNWHKSPKASQLMLSLSKLDPATMSSEVGGGGLGWGNSDNSGNNETDW